MERLTRTQLGVALIVATSAGCFGSHGVPPDRPDGGAIADAALLCAPAAGAVTDLDCGVDLSGSAFALVTAAPHQCCSSGTLTTTTVATGAAFDIGVSLTACECCATCRCVGPFLEERISLGRLAPGHYTVRAEGRTCDFDVAPPSECSRHTPDSAIVPRVRFADQPFVASILSSSAGGCGCQPRASWPDPRGGIDFSLCSCCEMCDCIDPGYEVGVVSPQLPLGDHDIVIPHGVAPYTVVASADHCAPAESITALALRDAPAHVEGGARVDWLVVRGQSRRCCTEPLPAVREGVGPSGEIALSLHDCVTEDCECVGGLVDFEALHPLVDLPSGRHRVRAGGHTLDIDVP